MSQLVSSAESSEFDRGSIVREVLECHVERTRELADTILDIADLPEYPRIPAIVEEEILDQAATLGCWVGDVYPRSLPDVNDMLRLGINEVSEAGIAELLTHFTSDIPATLEPHTIHSTAEQIYFGPLTNGRLFGLPVELEAVVDYIQGKQTTSFDYSDPDDFADMIRHLIKPHDVTTAALNDAQLFLPSALETPGSAAFFTQLGIAPEEYDPGELSARILPGFASASFYINIGRIWGGTPLTQRTLDQVYELNNLSFND